MATTIDDILNNGSGSKLVTTPWTPGAARAERRRAGAVADFPGSQGQVETANNGGQTANGATQGGMTASGEQTTNATTSATPMKPAVGNGYTYLQDKDGELTPAPGTPGAAQAAAPVATQDAPKGVQAATPEEVEGLAASIKPAEVAKPEALAQQKTEGSDYDKLIAELEARRARHEKDRKRERQERLIYAIGDGIAALGGLVTASTKGGVSAYNPKMNMSQAAQERWDRYHKERDEDEKGYLDEYLKVMNAKRAEEIAKSKNWVESEKLRLLGEKTSAEIQVKVQQVQRLISQGRLDEARALLTESQTALNNARAENQTIKNETQSALDEATVELRKAQAERSRAAASKAAAGGGGGGNNGSTTEYEEWVDEQGRKHKVVNKNVNNGKGKPLPKGKKNLPK